MRYKNILITGGAGFVGSNLCIKLKLHYPDITVTAFDNLKRRGSELNLARLKKYGVCFVHGDIRNSEDLDFEKVDLLIECSAEPSVMAGVNSSPEYVLNTNLVGAINCFELARKKNADVVFLSTSRVYPTRKLNEINIIENESRYTITDKQTMQGVSLKGINETFPLNGSRSIYGATKLAAELLLQEYSENYGIKSIINRFGVIAGPWQMGKVDQGVVTLWLARHIFKKPLSYIGFGGKGKQVRDIIHVDDVFDILNLQINNMRKYNNEIFNIGGGLVNSLSLLELTSLCQQITGTKVKISPDKQTRQGDIMLYISNNTKITNVSGWKPKKTIKQTLTDIHKWISENKNSLRPILE